MKVSGLALIVVVLISIITARAADSPADNVARLDSPDPADRAAALETLINAGTPAVPALKSAAADPRPQVAHGARLALRWIALFHRDGIRDETFRQIEAYRTADSSSDRTQILYRLCTADIPPGSLFARLITLEPDQQLRRQMFKMLGDHFLNEFSRIYVDDNDPEGAVTLLQAAATFGDRDGAADYAAFAHLTGLDVDMIPQLQAERVNGDLAARQRAAAFLCYLYRVANKPAEAMEMARASGDQQLVLLLLNDAGDWAALVNEPDDRFTDPLQSIALNAMHERLAGHVETAKSLMAAFVDIPPDSTPHPYASKLFLLTDRPADGIVLMESQHPLAAFRMHLLRGEVDAAIALARNVGPNSNETEEVAAALRNLRKSLAGMPEDPPTSQPTKPPTDADRHWTAGLDLLQKRQYQLAAADFAAAWNSEEKPPAALYLQGRALTRAGDPAAGERLMELARIVPAGDPYLRWRFARSLRSAGLDKLADSQSDLALRTGGQFDEIGFSEIYNDRRNAAARDSRWSDAADAAERVCLVHATQSVSWQEPAWYLRMPAYARLYRARALRSKNDWPAATAVFDDFLAYMPIDVGATIEWVTALDLAGQHAAADKLFTDVNARMTALTTAYPAFGDMHNQIAWMNACCNRQLDDALTHAQIAADIRKQNWESLDTLAEVRFRRGERSPAIENETRALSQLPNDPYLQRQIVRYRNTPVPSITQPVAEPE